MAFDFSELSKVSSLLNEQGAGNGIRRVRVDSIQPDPNQPRKTFDQESLAELAQSIQSMGIVQPPVVRTHTAGYMLISGERRWRAAGQLGLQTIEIIVRDDLSARAQLVENIQREALSAWEIYRVIGGELEAGAKQLDLAKAFGKSKQWISAYASIAKMPEPFIALLRDNRVSGITALHALYRLHQDRPEVAKQLLDSSDLITTVGVAHANAGASPQNPNQAADSSRAISPDPGDKSQNRATRTPFTGCVVEKDVEQTSPVGNPARTPSARKSLPIRIRAHYDNANWIVDYTRQRSEADGTVSVMLEGAEADVRFAPIAALRLQSIDVIE